jgi:hypothetical protein
MSLLACEPDPAVNDDWHEAFDARSTGWLMATFSPPGTAGKVRYAVGGAPDAGVVMRDDGHGWAPVALGAAGEGVPLLNWVTGFGEDAIVVVGGGGAVLRWDGAAWTREATPTDQDLWGVWGPAADDLWAVGGTVTPGGHPVILHHDGIAWTEVALPTLQKGNVRAFFKVWGAGRDHALVVGQNGVVLRWDGAIWTEELVGASADLIALWGTGKDHVVMVGGRGNAIVTTWDGVRWRTENLAPLSGLNGVWMREPDVIHVVGTLGTVGELDFATLAPHVRSLSEDLDFHAVFGDEAGRISAVGGSFRSIVAPFEGMAWERELDDGE